MSASHDSRFDYEYMVQSALRGVVRSVLEDVSKHGLPGNHHFYIAFRTDHPGVRVPDHLRERYPEEITIVIQHQFDNLRVFPDHFEVQLSFNRKAENLVVPFAALSGFMDPSVQFGLQLQPAATPAEKTPDPHADTGPEPDGGDDDTPTKPTDGGDNVVALDIFRKNAKP
jgi:hypothetical protein